MANQRNEQLIRRLYELLNANRIDEAESLYSPNWAGHGIGRTIDGKRRRENLENTLASTPDRQITVDLIMSDGDFVAVHTTSRGTHTGHLTSVTGIEVPPTGRKTEVTGMQMYRIANGQIAETWGVLDRLTLMQQLGVVPDPRAEASRT